MKFKYYRDSLVALAPYIFVIFVSIVIASTAATQTTVETAVSSSTQPSGADFVAVIRKALKDWNTIGWIAFIIAALQICIKALKFKPINAWFTKRKLKWVKPYIAMLFGGIIGALSAYTTGAEMMQSFVAGSMAAMASIGWNETINKTKSENRKK